MRMLVAEDDRSSMRRLREQIETLGLPIEVVHVASRNDACEAIDSTDFDLIVCDLHLPLHAGEEPSLDHGLGVLECSDSQQPGTPSMLITGSGDERAARARIAGRTPADIFGVGAQYPMCDLFYKHEPDQYLQRIAEVATQIELLRAIEVHTDDPAFRLRPAHTRILRIFARRHGARRVEVSNLGGLSASIAVRASLLDEQGQATAAVFAKLAPLEDIADEARRYRLAALRLPAGSYAPLLETVEAGAGRIGGLFYGLADRHPDTLFERLGRDPAAAAAAVDELQHVLTVWREEGKESALVTSLRRTRVGGQVLEPHLEALGPDWREFERARVDISRALHHGDLHGGNVLLGPTADPLLIDFANVEVGPEARDPLILELSVVFHASSPLHGGAWPSLEQCEQWDDLEVYVEGCGAAEFVRQCRQWALATASDPAAPYALAYAEALRQLEFVPGETERALAIARAALRRGLDLLTTRPEPEVAPGIDAAPRGP